MARLRPACKQHKTCCRTAFLPHRESAGCPPSPYTSTTSRPSKVRDASLNFSRVESASPSEPLSARRHSDDFAAAPAVEGSTDVPAQERATGMTEDPKDIAKL